MKVVFAMKIRTRENYNFSELLLLSYFFFTFAFELS